MQTFDMENTIQSPDHQTYFLVETLPVGSRVGFYTLQATATCTIAESVSLQANFDGPITAQRFLQISEIISFNMGLGSHARMLEQYRSGL